MAASGAEAARRADAAAFFAAAFAACEGLSHRAPASMVVAAPVAFVHAHLPLEHVLPLEERTRIAHHANAADRAARVASWGLVRHLLAHVLDCAPAAVGVRRAPSGRPSLVGGGACDFNLSHGADWVAVGLAQGGSIGVDVEGPHPLALWQDMAPLFLDEQALSDWRAFPPQEQASAALSAWCLKEAVLKATGEGLSGDPRSVAFTPPHEGADSTFPLRRAGAILHAGTSRAAAPRCIAFAVEGDAPPPLFIWPQPIAWPLIPPSTVKRRSGI